MPGKGSQRGPVRMGDARAKGLGQDAVGLLIPH